MSDEHGVEAPAVERVRWVTAEALKALAERDLGRAGAQFTGTELAAWTTTLDVVQRVHASSRLCALGFVSHAAEIREIDGHAVRVDVYSVTAEGAAAICAAAAGHVRKSGPKGSRAPNAIDPDAFASRLWRLVRVRKIVDADSLAATLSDAGQNRYATVRETVRKYLRRWANAGALHEGARRINAQGHSNGIKRYVLSDSAGPTPPRWRSKGNAS